LSATQTQAIAGRGQAMTDAGRSTHEAWRRRCGSYPACRSSP